MVENWCLQDDCQVNVAPAQLLKCAFDLPTVAIGLYHGLGVRGSWFTGKVVDPIDVSPMFLLPVWGPVCETDGNETVIAVAVP